MNTFFQRSSRRGFLLPIVGIVMTIIALGVCRFTDRIISKAVLVDCSRAEIEARNVVKNAILWTSHLAQTREWSDMSVPSNGDSYRHHSDFRTVGESLSVSLAENVTSRHDGTLCVASWGLLDESGKLDLNWLAENDSSARTRLLHIPNMTPRLADSILDWIDSDDLPREFGAERNFYLTRGLSVLPPNKPIRQLGDLLQVAGVTEDLLYGSAISREAAYCRQLQIPHIQNESAWSRYLTVYAAEGYGPSDTRIFLNQPSLEQLYADTRVLWGSDAAQFVVAARLFGLKEVGARKSSFGNELSAAERRQSQNVDPVKTSQPKSQSQVGLDLSRKPRFFFLTVLDLVGTSTEAVVGGQKILLSSPWHSPEQISTLRAGFRIVGENPLRGRLNLLTAPLELLRSFPELLSDAKAKQIVELRSHPPAQGLSFQTLVEQRIFTLNQLRSLATTFTERGNVLSTIVVSEDDERRYTYAAQFTIDGTSTPPLLLNCSPTTRITGLLTP